MSLVQVVKEQGLSGESMPVGKTEEGKTDDYRGRASVKKGSPKEEAAMEAKRMVVRSKELLMSEVLKVTRPVVVEVGTSEPRMEAVVSKATTKAAKAAKSSYSMGPDLCGQEHGDKDDKSRGYSFHISRPPGLS